MGFETLKNIIEYNKLQEELGKQEAIEPTECSEDAWPLNVNSKNERSCPICGRVWRI